MVKIRAPLSLFKKARTEPGPVTALQMGDAARDKGDWNKAADYYRQHLTSKSDDFGIWVQLGHALKEAGRLDEARGSYEQAQELKSDDADLYLNRGHLEKLSGDLETAAQLYAISAEIDPSNNASNELVHLSRHVSSIDVNRLKQKSSIGVNGSLKTTRGHIEACQSGYVTGWVSNTSKTAVSIEVLVDDTVIARGKSKLIRPDVSSAGFGDGPTGFRILLDGKVRIGDTVSLRVKGEEKPFSRVTVESPKYARPWMARNSELSRDSLLSIKRRCNNEIENLKLSIVMACYNTPETWLKEALDSLLDQWCDNWELICVDDASPKSEVRDIIADYQKIDDRIRLVELDTNSGISKAVNAGIAAATGDYIAFMDHDDVLEPEAVYRLLDAARSNVGLIYTDEAITTGDISEIQSFALRPAFSHDYYLGHPYFVHLVCVRTDIARQIGGYDEQMKISADVDFVLRAIEKTDQVAHVPAILYRWRTHPTSTGHSRKHLVTKATVSALNAHLKRMAIEATAKAGACFNTFRIDYVDRGGRTLIIIPTKDHVELLESCLESLWKTTKPDDVDIVVIDHESKEPATLRYFKKIEGRVKLYPYRGPFNFGRMNNEAFNDCWDGHDYVLFMNNDIEAIEEGWLERLRSHAARPEVGVVGANLLYSDRRVQHSGVILGINGPADHAHKFADFEAEGDRNPGYGSSLVATREYSAVTAACMMMRCDVFQGLGGYDDALEIGFNDTDLCLRAGDLGYAIINDAYAVLYHHESTTRIKTSQVNHPEDNARFIRRWQSILAFGDPFYNPMLSTTQDHVYGNLTDAYHPYRVRSVRPTLRPLMEGRPRQIPSPH